jgi:p21-activated kinase 1
MPATPDSPSKHASMQPTRPAPTPPIGVPPQSPSGSPVKRSPSSPYPSRSAADSAGGGSVGGSRPIITALPSSGLPISELVPHRPAPRPPPPPPSSSAAAAGKRTSNVLVKGGAHRFSQSTSSINSSERSSRSSPSYQAQRGPPPPAQPTYIPISPPMQYNTEFSNSSAPPSARLPTNGAGGMPPATPSQRSRADSRRSDGTSPITSRRSPRAHSDEYGSTKSDKSIFGKFVSGMAKGLGSNSSKKEKMEISTPYDPVHLTHVGFNYHTGEFTV